MNAANTADDADVAGRVLSDGLNAGSPSGHDGVNTAPPQTEITCPVT